jgi:magnesium transporter
MIQRHAYNGFTWVDCECPTDDEVRGLIDEFGIEQLVAKELLTPTVRSRVEPYPGYLYVILHFPNLTDDGDVEVDFVIGKDFIVTTHYRSVDSILEFSKLFEVDSILDRSNIGKHPGFVFYYMLRELYQGLGDQLDVLSSVLSDIETNIFDEREREMVIELSLTNRKLLRFRSSLQHHHSVVSSFEQASVKLFGEDYMYYARAIVGEYAKVASTLDHLRAYLSELRSTNDSLLSTKQNEIMKNLTIMAFVAIPLTLIASIFGMNITEMPIVREQHSFWLILILMATVATCAFSFFKYKRWI